MHMHTHTHTHRKACAHLSTLRRGTQTTGWLRQEEPSCLSALPSWARPGPWMCEGALAPSADNSDACSLHLAQFSSVDQSISRVRLFATPWTAARQDSLSLPIPRSLPEFMPIALMMPSCHLTLWHTLFSFFPQSFPYLTLFLKLSSQLQKQMISFSGTIQS